LKLAIFFIGLFMTALNCSAQAPLVKLVENKPDFSSAKATLLPGGKILLSDVLLEKKGLYELELGYNSSQGNFVLLAASPKSKAGQFMCRAKIDNVNIFVFHSNESNAIMVKFTVNERVGFNPYRMTFVQQRRKLNVVRLNEQLNDDTALGESVRSNDKFDGEFVIQPGVDLQFAVTRVPGWFDFTRPLESITSIPPLGFTPVSYKCEL